MANEKIGFEFKKFLPVLSIAALGLGLSLLAIDYKRVKFFLNREFQETFENLVTRSGEKDEIQMALENLPDDSEHVLAGWMNAALNKRRRVNKPHLLMKNIIMTALERGGNRE